MSNRACPNTKRAFKRWFLSRDWWHENTARDRLGPVYFALSETMNADDVEEFLDEVISVMKNEYGE